MATITGTLHTPAGALFSGDVQFLSTPPKARLVASSLVTAETITSTVTGGALSQVLESGTYQVVMTGTRPFLIAVPDSAATIDIRTLVSSGTGNLPDVEFDTGMPPGGVPGDALVRMGAGNFGTIWGTGIQPRIEWYGGVADMVIDSNKHISGTDNTDALIACLTAHGKCHLHPSKSYAFRRGVDVAQIPQIASGEWQMVITCGDGEQKAEVGFLDGTLAPSTGATGSEIALPWWTSGTWSADYLVLGKAANMRNAVISGIRFYPNQKYRPTKFAGAGTYIRLSTVLCYLYGVDHRVDNYEVIRPGVNRGNAANMPETFVVGITRNPSLPVSGEWATSLGPFTFPVAGEEVTIDVLGWCFDLGETVYFQGLGFAKATNVVAGELTSAVTFEVIECDLAAGHYSRGNDDISVTLDTPIIRPGFNADWTTHDGPKIRNARYIGPPEPAPVSDYTVTPANTRGPELTLLLVDAPGYMRHLYRGVVVEDIHFENLLNSADFPRAIHGVTVANTIGTRIANITANQFSGCLWYLDAWIALDMEVRGLKARETQSLINSYMGSYGFVGSESSTGRAFSASPFRVSPWWQLRFHDLWIDGRQMWPGQTEYSTVFSCDSNGKRPAWGNVGHYDRLWYHDSFDSTAGPTPPITFVAGDGYAFGDLRFRYNVMAFRTTDADPVLVEGLRTCWAFAAGLRYCRRLVWENNRTPAGELVGVWHNYNGGGLIPEVLIGQSPMLSDNRNRSSTATPDENGRVTLHLTAEGTSRLQLRRVTRWTGGATKLLLPKCSTTRRWFAGADVIVENYPSAYHVHPGTIVTIVNEGVGTLTIEEWSKAGTPLETTLTTIASGASKTFISGLIKADGHWYIQ